MKQKYTILFLAVLSAVFSCVQVDEGMLDENSAAEKIEMTFTATIDVENADTKTVLDGELGSGTRKVLWQPSDAIAVVAPNGMNAGWLPVEKFTATITDESESATFEGTISFASEYRAFYPYQTELRDSMGFFVFNMPQVQKYVDGSFDPNSAPMVAVAKHGENLKFRNLCGVLALRLAGNESVKRVTFIGRDENGNAMPVSGNYEVNPGADGDPELRCLRSVPSITLECASEVALGSESSVPFYFVLPPATYSSFLVMIETMDGKIMLKEGKSPLTIKRSDVKPTAALQYAETVYIDLSETGHANSYIVPKSGLYSFDADVIGNGVYGLIDGVAFHTSNTTIAPVSVEVLWQDRDNVVSGINLDGNKVKFISTGLEGNAVIAARDANGTILWSWHIWVTDQPVDQEYINSYGNFTLQDRNLGAIRADRGSDNDWRDAAGLMYQWGRKDPFAIDQSNGNAYYAKNASRVSVSESVTSPTLFHGTGYEGWESSGNQNLWTPSQKTIYDPCPVGYKVAVTEAWRGFIVDGYDQSGNSQYYSVSGGYDYGWNFYYDGTNTTYYPSTGYITYSGNMNSSSTSGRLWSASSSSDNAAVYFYFYYNNDANSHIYLSSSDYKSYGYAVRCMKDKDHFDISYPAVKTVSVRDISSESAVLVAKVESEGISPVTSRGIIWGKTEDLSDGIQVPCGVGAGEFTTTLSGLEHSTRYYFKAYAVNGRGCTESKVASFYTPYSGGATDLSANGTANCYIVPPVYTDYVFNCSVKGSSNESVGVPASAEVLWETRLSYESLSVGSVIESVELVGNFVKFRLPFDTRPGNALIAVKDASGTILWSWHIWVVDFDPDKTGCKLISGAKVMDRNLGALSVIPEDKGAMTTDYSAYGLYYQWGRKDPFAWDCNVVPTGAIKNFDYDSSYDSVEASVQYPTHCYDEVRWGDDTSLWNYMKTKYDPCPAGWKVTESAVWEGMTDVNFENTADLYLTVSGSYSSPSLIIPYGGYYDYGQDNTRIGFNDWMRLWNSDCQSCLYAPDTMLYLNSESVDCSLPVRCMKDDPQKPGNGDDVIVDDEYEW